MSLEKIKHKNRIPLLVTIYSHIPFIGKFRVIAIFIFIVTDYRHNIPTFLQTFRNSHCMCSTSIKNQHSIHLFYLYILSL